MAGPLRILILDRNRYRSLLLDRAVSKTIPSSIIARFNSGTEVVRELLATRHDVAILSLDGIERPVDMVQAARLVRPDIKLIVAGLPETPKRVIAAIQPLVDTFLCWDTDQGAPLPESICSAIAVAAGIGPEVQNWSTDTEEPVLVG